MKRLLSFFLFCVLGVIGTLAQHPKLLLTKEELGYMKQHMNEVPAFGRVVDDLLQKADEACAAAIQIPTPVDGGGGAVHEQHKSNYYAMFHAGLAYQYTGHKKYADFVAQMLMEYAQKYPKWGLHPVSLSPVPGRLFWQTLNESVWLVHTAMAYDCVYDALSAKQRKFIEKNLLFNMADFIMNGYGDRKGNLEIFNRMHNHATWATSAVGMVGMTTGNQSLVRKALYGTDETGKKGGFLRQMDHLFSPDGYYTEGAYYQRYAIWPFVVFAQSIDHCMPELDIFHRRDGILVKALDALVQMSYEGEFFHINDALEKGLSAQEMVYAANIIYGKFPENKSLLAVMKNYQTYVLPIAGGFMAQRDMAQNATYTLQQRSCVLSDGRDGKDGGLAIIRPRSAQNNSAITLKATSQGMGHGHYDKLAMAYYDNGHEILTDYGASRFLNIEAKHGGHYTKENNTYAKQTIAHNTVVVDQKTNYGGKLKVAEQYHANIVEADFSHDGWQMVMARDTNAYKGVDMVRTIVYASVPFLERPLICDVFRLKSDEVHDYDYPLWYNGHLVSVNYPYQRNLEQMVPLGKKAGYQHLWLEATGQNTSSSTSCLTFFNGNRFYSVNYASSPATEFKFVALGANDPDFNLLHRSGYIIREKGKKNHTFAVSIETHGEYDVLRETSRDLITSCEKLEILFEDDSQLVLHGVYAGHDLYLLLADDEAKEHVAQVGNKTFRWSGRVDIQYNH